MLLQFNPLPSNFVLAKPIGQESYDREILEDLQARGVLIGTRKRDGNKIIAEVCPGKKVRLYTSGMHEIDDRLCYIKDEIADLRLSEGTVLIGELILPEGDVDDLGRVGSFLRASTAKAKEMLRHGVMPRMIVFNILHYQRGTLVSPLYHQVKEELARILVDPAYVEPVGQLTGSLRQMIAQANQLGWEGLVLYDRDYQLTWKLGNTEPRPKGCYKLKPVNEDDFIVLAHRRRLNEDGSLHDVDLFQRDPVTKKLFRCGSLGTFNAAIKKSLSAKNWKVLVMQAKYVRRFAKSGKLREPAFMRLRDDKSPDSCIAPASYPEAEYLL